MSTMTAAAPAAPTAEAEHPLSAWHVAYLITGDRAAAHRVVEAVLGEHRGAPPPSAARLHAAVARRARAEARRTATGGGHEPLWVALQGLPRRERAAIVARLMA